MTEVRLQPPNWPTNKTSSSWTAGGISSLLTSSTTASGSGPGGSGDHQGGGFAGDGGPATEALLKGPSDVAFDSRRNICIADVGNLSVRCVEPQGIIRTVAGHGPAYPGDGGPGTEANLIPYRIAFDPTGNMHISDYADGRIRKLDVNGIISTVAGFGNRGFSGDGGPALLAQFDYGSGLTIDAQQHSVVRRQQPADPGHQTGSHRRAPERPRASHLRHASVGAARKAVSLAAGSDREGFLGHPCAGRARRFLSAIIRRLMRVLEQHADDQHSDRSGRQSDRLV